MQWLGLPPYSKKALGLNLPADWGSSCLESSCSPRVYVGFLCSGFLPVVPRHADQVNWQLKISNRCEWEHELLGVSVVALPGVYSASQCQLGLALFFL